MTYRFESEHEMAWCPGCGNFAIRAALIGALGQTGIEGSDIVIASGIGQAAKMPHYVRACFFNGLHGRALPAAAGIKAANPGLLVIAEGGDGDMYGEGGNHLIHAIRRNPDMTLIVHDNMVYGLTKGQASPTSREGMVTPVQVEGVKSEPLDPIALAIALDAPFVARALSGDIEKTQAIIKAAMDHKGFSLVDILQPCPSFNKINTLRWYREHSYYVGEEHDPTSRAAAFALALDEERFPLGVIYRKEGRTIFEEGLRASGQAKGALAANPARLESVREFLRAKRSA
jgi:2-oxoglutarate ferredoxin oxidoreductase subunit beta